MTEQNDRITEPDQWKGTMRIAVISLLFMGVALLADSAFGDSRQFDCSISEAKTWDRETGHIETNTSLQEMELDEPRIILEEASGLLRLSWQVSDPQKYDILENGPGTDMLAIRVSGGSSRGEVKVFRVCTWCEGANKPFLFFDDEQIFEGSCQVQ